MRIRILIATALTCAAARSIKLDPIVTRNLPLAEYRDALDIARRRLEHAIKVSMTP